MFRSLSFRNPRKISFIAGLAVALAALLGTATVAVSRVSAADCDSNAIIYCGFTSPSNFISTVKSNQSNNGHHDLQGVYAFYGLRSGDYSNFAANAVAGTAYKDGRIVVDGKVVATAGKSIGREASFQGSGYFKQPIGNGTYYGNTNAKAFASDSLPVYVLFDSQGTMQFAVIKSCGNPEFGTVVRTAASCRELTKTAVSGQLNTYDFTATANVSGNATVKQYVFNFGDGSTQTVRSNATSVKIRHTYTKAGNFTAKVTEFANVPGNDNLQLPVISTCTKAVTVQLPFYSCTSLTGAILDKSKFAYSFTAKANYGNGATFASADFVFGDGTSQKGVKPSSSTAVTVTHTYAKAGTYNIAATLHFMVNGKAVTANTCTARLTPTTPPTPTCKPNVPVGSPECLPPCTEGSSVPPTAEQCQPPVLPNTGAGNTIAIFAGVVVAAFLVYRQLLFRRHKAAFLAAQRNTAPLPLGDPLNDEAPLAGTPLAPKRRSFRRKRPF